jgi:DsbC/DsbD-like thiol-disulfide interchange protein
VTAHFSKLSIMNRRSLLQLPLVLLAAPAIKAAPPQPWSARLLQGAFDGEVYWAGIAIALEPHWKTYWRVPGDGGISPQFEVTGENLKSHRIDYPMPQRYVDAAGTTNGYKDEVIFPVALTPTDAAQPVTMMLKSFFGVCDVVCIPAQFEAAITFKAATAQSADQPLIEQWRRKVPLLKAQGPVGKATAMQQGDKFLVQLEVTEAVAVMFVEGKASHYFGQPVVEGSAARVPVSGAKSLDELRATPLRISLQTSDDTGALEQLVPVL